MAATVGVRVSSAPLFPVGTVIAAYSRQLWPGPPPVPGQAGVGTAVSTATVESPGQITVLGGLEPETGYYVGGIVAGVWRWTTIFSPAFSAASSSLSRLDAVVSLAATTATTTLPETSVAQVVRLTLEVATTKIVLPRAAPGDSFELYRIQDASGSRANTWEVPEGGVIRWPEQTVPTPSSTAHAVDRYVFGCALEKDWDGVLVGKAIG